MNPSPFHRRLPQVGLFLLVGWLVFFSAQYARHRMRMREIANELLMDYRTFHIVGEPLQPPTPVDGEERLLVAGESSENFLLCSIVRNPQHSDSRAKWKVDHAFRPDIQTDYPRLPIWEPLNHFPTAADLKRFRSLARQEAWGIWDCPEGSDPETDQ